MLVGGRDVLAAEAELLDDHILRDAARRADLRGGHPALGEVVGCRDDPTRVIGAVLGAEGSRDDAAELVLHVGGQLVAAGPEDPAHPDELADPHQRPGEQLGVAVGDLPRIASRRPAT